MPYCDLAKDGYGQVVRCRRVRISRPGRCSILDATSLMMSAPKPSSRLKNLSAFAILLGDLAASLSCIVEQADLE